jgi:cobalt-precorrin 5A hydrolase
MGVSSVAEAAALAAGGPDARLVVPRIAIGPATCALADSGAAP